MKRALPLLLTAAAAFAGAVACSGGGGGGSGTVHGFVRQPDTAIIVGATVDLGGQQALTDVDGAFTMTLPVGTHTLTVTLAGFRTLQSQLLVVKGDNQVHLTLVPCTVGIDAGCGSLPSTTPIPTPPGTNVAAMFVGTNIGGGASSFPSWTGSAVLHYGAGNQRTIGEDGDFAEDDAFAECYKSNDQSKPTVAGDPLSAVNHCLVWFYGFNQGKDGGVFGSGPDALFLVYVGGPSWRSGAVLQFGQANDPVAQAAYFDCYGGDPGTPASGAPYQQGVSVDRERDASAGIFRLSAAGYLPGQPVVLTTAWFVVPSLP